MNINIYLFILKNIYFDWMNTMFSGMININIYLYIF